MEQLTVEESFNKYSEVLSLKTKWGEPIHEELRNAYLIGATDMLNKCLEDLFPDTASILLDQIRSAYFLNK